MDMKWRFLITQFITIIILPLLLECCKEIDKIQVGHYYLDSQTGNDDNIGTSAYSPWKSLNKLEKMNFQSGDSLFFARGSEFKGGFILKSAGTKEGPMQLW